MTVRIRLARHGSHKRPFYKIVIANSQSPRDGKFKEKIGTYNPLLSRDNEDRIKINLERLHYWLGVGAQPSDRVQKFIKIYAGNAS